MNDTYAFNPFVPGFDEDPAPAYRELRTRAPVYFWPMAEAYLVSRYHDIVAMMKDPRLSRSQRDGKRHQPLPDVAEYAEYRTATENGLFQVAREDHLRLRRLVNPGFTPRAIEQLRADILAITRDALARLPDDAVVDLLGDGRRHPAAGHRPPAGDPGGDGARLPRVRPGPPVVDEPGARQRGAR